MTAGIGPNDKAGGVIGSHPRLGSLDGLRAFAVSFVFVHHLAPCNLGGAVGVDVFFVLSGFLITNLFLREYSVFGAFNIRRFYLRRLIRLYPPLILMMVVVFVPGLVFSPSKLKFLGENALALSYLTPVALEFRSGASEAFRHTWSLGIEEIFYLFWPWILAVLLSRFRGRMAIAVATGSVGLLLLIFNVVLTVTGVFDNSLLLRSGGLLAGSCVALVLDLGRVRLSHRSGYLGVLLVLAAAFGGSFDAIANAVWVVVAVLGSCVLLVCLISDDGGRLSSFLCFPPFRYVGRISYEIYLWHYSVFVIAWWALGGTATSYSLWVGPLSLGFAAVSHAIIRPYERKLKVRYAP